MKVEILVDYDYIMGYLRYGHREGILDIPANEVEEFKKDPDKYLSKRDLINELEFILDDYEIEDMGGREVWYKEID